MVRYKELRVNWERSVGSKQHEGTPEPGAANAGVAAVDRALSILEVFNEHDRGLSLAEIARRTGYYKSTVLRLLSTLEAHRFVTKLADGRYNLGSKIALLNQIYVRSDYLQSFARPILRNLADATRESASLQVRDGDGRVVVMRIDSAHQVRDHVLVGTKMPLDAGAPGHVLTRFAHGPGGKTGKDLVIASYGERDSEAAGVSAPIFGSDNKLVAALCVTGTIARFQDKKHLQRAQELILRAAEELTGLVGGNAYKKSDGAERSK